MKLNTLRPARGGRHRAKRVGRGVGSGVGKTCGRGHKGQHSRSGGFRKLGFEGGQMPLQRRLPKVGFRSRRKDVCVLRSGDLAKVDAARIDLGALKSAKLVGRNVTEVKLVLSGEVSRAVVLKGIKASAGARAAIEAADGSVEP